jgi:hypothetical protein
MDTYLVELGRLGLRFLYEEISEQEFRTLQEELRERYGRLF